jgi:serine/threonine-protein kinase
VLKIADFGMTRLVEASTRTETLKGGGTPFYMPPEGWAGLTGPTPTAAYDLYSLGVILYEIATLQSPFSGDRDELRHAHLFTEPRTPRELRPDLPAPVERMILKLLRKTPAERGAPADEALALLALVEDPADDVDDPTSEVLTRLQAGATALMLRAAEQEAEAARVRDERRTRQELLAQATAGFDAMIHEAIKLVERNVAPLQAGASVARWRRAAAAAGSR